MLQLIFAATILLSAALMFTVEFMFAKMVLPRLGGSPAVWNTCLVFYQAVLMAGYVYAHLSLKWLGPRRQSLLHVALLCAACISLPIGVARGWTPPSEGNPVAWLLALLAVCLGLPFFCISASAPLLQAWFSRCGGRAAKDPYFLYAASNLGSLAGLAAYPLVIERFVTLKLQTQWWSAGYGLLIGLFGICAAAVWIAGRRTAAATEAVASNAAEEATQAENEDSLPAGFHAPITLPRRLWWLALALVPSALLMGVTAHLSVDIASVPLLWAIPLGLYLLSFILVFARWPILKWLWLLRIFQAAGLAGAAATIYLGGVETKDIMHVGALHLATFFLTALVCHGAMAADRPASRHLTEFYLWMSAGGVVGGLLCALVAPLIFDSVLEYPLMLVAACLLCPPSRSRQYEQFWRRRLWWLALTAAPAALLIGVTAHFSIDEALPSLLWAVPPGLYLLSLIMAFARWPILKWLWLLRIFQAAAIAAAAATIYFPGLLTKSDAGVAAIQLAAFFLTALVFHGAMAADRPASEHLTEYYLCIWAGAIGGGLICADLTGILVFNSAPEYPLLLVAACLLCPLPRSGRNERFWRWLELVVMLVQCGVLVFAVGALWQGRLAGMAEKWSSNPLKTFAPAIDDPTARIRWIIVAVVLTLLVCAFAACALGRGRFAGMVANWSSKRLKTFALAIANPAAKIYWVIAAGILAFLVCAFAACFLWQERLAGMTANWRSEGLKSFVLAITDSSAKIYWIELAGILAFLLQRRRARFAIAIATLLGVCVICGKQENVIDSARSFFGVLRVERGHYDRDGHSLVTHTLMHGSTMHGEQSLDPDDELDPWTYYSRSGPVGDVFDAVKHRPAFLRHGHIGVVGLGTGTVASYAQPGQSLTYFEIDAAVRQIAKDPAYFTYISNCKVEPQIRMGDARLTLAQEPDGQFDLLLIDAFSSDAIPIHLLTREAVEMYFQKLAPHGLLMVHLSNRHLALEPVVAGVAEASGVVARVRSDDDEDAEIGKSSSTWAVLANKPEDLGALNKNKDWNELKAKPGAPLWTDDYSSIISVMHWDWLPKWLRPGRGK